MRTQGKIFVVVVCLIMAAMSVASFATDTNVTITGGDIYLTSALASVPSDKGGSVGAGSNLTTFDAVVINVKNAAPVPASGDNEKVEYIRVDDDRATAQGWNVTVAIDDLKSTTIPDTTASNGDTVSVTIPVEKIFTFKASDSAIIDGSVSLMDSVTMDHETFTPASKSGVRIFSAASGYGAGAYSCKPHFKLTFDSHYLPSGSTVQPTSSDSELDEVANQPDQNSHKRVPLLAGAYTTTITYTLIASP